MGLRKYKIKDLITAVDERNSYGIRSFYGLNINKEFMPTVANAEGLDEAKYKVVRKNRFVFSGMQTGRDMCIRISMYTASEPVIVSPAYTTFEVTATDLVLPTYFFMCFLSKEKDRLGGFLSDSSIRSNLDWPVFCDIELVLPPLPIQRKYVDIYLALLANQQGYERGLGDLQLVCDGYFDMEKESNLVKLGELLERVDRRNSNHLFGAKDVRGITNHKEFAETKADIDNTDLSKFKIVHKNEFAYNGRTDGRDMLVLALNRSDSVIVTFNYNVFKIKDEKTNVIIPEYLYTFFKRTEFDRLVRFHSWGSSQELLSWADLCEIKIPVPGINEQKALSKIDEARTIRRALNEKLKAQIRDVCPVLIRGSLEDGG